MLPEDELKKLKAFTEVVKKNPQVLNAPELSFFKEFLESFKAGAFTYKTDDFSSSGESKPAEEYKIPEPEKEDSEEESDVELDNTGVIEEPDELSDTEITVNAEADISDENIEKASDKKSEAVHAFNDGNFEEAIKLYSEAIALNPGMSLLYAKRAQCYLKLNKPNACIRDCTAALKLNPDNAAAYKFRGRAHRLLGHWLDAAKDLRSACKIDCDEQADEWLKEVTPNARKLEEHQRKYERQRAEKEIKEKQERVKRAKEEHAKASAAAGAQSSEQPRAGPGVGGMPPGFDDIFSDPETKEALSDPEVAAALEDITKNPSNFLKYMSNPKVMKLVNKLAGKMSGSGFPFPGGAGFGGGGAPGFGPGGAPGFGAGGAPGFGPGGAPNFGGTDSVD